MVKYIPRTVGSWLAGTFDRDRVVSKAAKNGIASFLDTDKKVIMFLTRCQGDVLEYAQLAVKETPESLSDERAVSYDDRQAKYFRVIESSVAIACHLLTKLPAEEISKGQGNYEEFLCKNKDLWAFITCPDAAVRRRVADLIIICLDKKPEFIEPDLALISRLFVAEGLRSSQSSSSLRFLESLLTLTTQFPQVWTSSYKGKKTPLTRLRVFLERGSQGAQSAVSYWKVTESLMGELPVEVLPSDAETSIEFLTSLRQGITHRGEPRNDIAEAWCSYFRILDRLAKHSSSQAGKMKILQESAFPIFGQHFHPDPGKPEWSGCGTAALLMAYCMGAWSDDNKEIMKKFLNLWQELSDDFASRITTSKNEESKDYQKSQAAIIAESRRWFQLLEVVSRTSDAVDPVGITSLIADKLIKTALITVVNRLGKPYSAAAVIDDALKFVPVCIYGSPATLNNIYECLEDHLVDLLFSPSSDYLSSILGRIGTLPEQKVRFKTLWNSTIEDLLARSEEPKKSQVIAKIVSSKDVKPFAKALPKLQDYFLSEASRILHGKSESWELTKVAIVFDLFTHPSAAKFLGQTISCLDVNSTDAESALKLLEFVIEKGAGLSVQLTTDRTFHAELITKLLHIAEIEESILALRAEHLRALVDDTEKAKNVDARDVPIPGLIVTSIIRENLLTAGPKHLTYVLSGLANRTGDFANFE